MTRRFPPHTVRRWLQGLRLRVLRRAGIAVVWRHRGHSIEIDPRDEFIAAELLVHGTWEEPLVAIVEQLPLEGRTAIDVGAHVGIYTLVLSDRVGPRGRVIALEPERVNFERLVGNVRRNRAGNVTPLALAAGAAVTSAWLERNPTNLGAHRISPRPTGRVVPIVPVDSLASPSEVAFVKIDAEGFEHEVLEGMRRIVEESRGLTMLVELELLGAGIDASARAVRRLGELGYEAFVHDGAFPRLESDAVARYSRSADRINAVFTRDREVARRLAAAGLR